jgi:acyl-CoA synthetase (AMP-forming)/AMP-acid ligase II
MMGSGITPAERKKEIFEKFPNSIATVDVFGQTEMTPDCIFKVDSGVDTLKDRSVGKPIRGVETRILNEEGEEIKNPGEIGEIVYRGPTVMKEYYKDEDKTREAFTKDGWFYSGDLGYFDEDGDYFIVDRKKECINTGGEKVYPHEIEEILETNPKVRYACIIGVPDPTWGQAVRAVIELRKGESATEEEIIDFCRDKMTGFKRPKSVVFADSLPLTPVEKVLRRKVVEKYGKL